MLTREPLSDHAGLPLLLKQPLDAACDRQWAEHNAAIADINHALNVL